MITIIHGTTREESIAKLKEMVANERPISVRWADFIEKGDYAFEKATTDTTAIAICDMPEGARPEFALILDLKGVWLQKGNQFENIKPKIFITTEANWVAAPVNHYQIIKP